MNVSKLKAAFGALAVSAALAAQPALADTHHHTHHHHHHCSCPHAKKHSKKHHAHKAKPKNPA
jgi:hypothetical protein